MKNLIISVLLVSILISITACVTNEEDMIGEAIVEINLALDKFEQAILEKDSSILENYLAIELISNEAQFNSSEYTENLQELLDGILSGISKFELQERTININEAITGAMVNSIEYRVQQVNDTLYDGHYYVWNFNFAKSDDGKWVINYLHEKVLS
jgi:hypothetical protein